MRKQIIPALLFFGSISTGAAALDLTPHEVARESNSPITMRYYFQDAAKRFSFRIDNKMTVHGTSQSASFSFKDIPDGSMKLSKSRLQPELPFEEKNLETYRAAASALLPAEATDVKLEEELPEAIAINGWSSRQYSFTFKLFGVARRRSVTFINFNPQEQIVFEIAAPEVNYEKTYARGYRVLNSLSDLLPGSGSGPT